MKNLFHSLLILLLLAACSKPDTSLKSYLLVLDRPANPNHIPLYVGNALGYFRNEGIVLNIQRPTTDKFDEVPCDFVLASLPRVFRAISRKSPLCVVGKLIDQPTKGFLTLHSSGLKSVDDFNGRIMGYDGAYSILPSAEVLLDANNVQVGCRFNLHDEAIPELLSEKIDIVYGALSNLEPEYVKSLGYKVRFFSVHELGMPAYDEVVVAANVKIKRDKKVVKAFQKALQRSINFCREKPELAFEMYVNLMHNKSPKSVQWEEKSWQLTVPLLAKKQQFSYQSVAQLADWQYEHGLVGTRIDIPTHFVSNLSGE